MFLDRMFSYTFSSMPLYFSEKLTSIRTDLPQFSLRSPEGTLCYQVRETKEAMASCITDRVLIMIYTWQVQPTLLFLRCS